MKGQGEALNLGIETGWDGEYSDMDPKWVMHEVCQVDFAPLPTIIDE
jgi:hypothetical protein